MADTPHELSVTPIASCLGHFEMIEMPRADGFGEKYRAIDVNKQR